MDTQIFPLPRLLHTRPPRRARPPPIHLQLSHLPCLSRLRRPRHRSDPTHTADPEEPQRALLQGVPTVGDTELACR